MGDLFKALFEDLTEPPDDDLVRLLEAAERVEKLEVKKKPLADALKDLSISGDMQATPDGIKLILASDVDFHAAVKLLGAIEVITQLAGHGWVPIVKGDTSPGPESPSYEVSFLEVDDVPLSSDTEAPSSEEIALTAAKFNGFADQDAKATQPPMQGNARGLVKGKKNESNASGVTRPVSELQSAGKSSDGVITLKDGSKWRPDGKGNATCVLPTQRVESLDVKKLLGKSAS